MNFRTLILLVAFAAHDCPAQSVQAPTSDASPSAQLAAFTPHEDFEISLWADETLGIANPIAIHWDSRGRLWVLTTLAYAQLAPGESASDTIVILEDTDADGRADQSTVFAEGLVMPLGFAILPDETGVYVGEGQDLVKLIDTDGDSRSDSREVVLTGFGTGDTHQNISNFTWGPEGNLWFSQGLHCFSRVETPWGIARGDTAGFWRFEPDALRLTPYCFPAMASQNPCGIAFDDTDALFIKSNNLELIYATPGRVPTTHPRNLQTIGNLGSTPGKSMGGEFANHSGHPDWLRRSILIAGYYSHRVMAFPLIEDGAGYRKVDPIELLVSSHESFRPVDIRVGPNDAIYVADWFNPIIGHYQASLRHPDRDRQHGRIWKLTSKTAGGPVKSHTATPMRERLDRVIAAANSDASDSLSEALSVLDAPLDRHLDYALSQTVHAKSDQIQTLTDTTQLAFALEVLATPEAASIARERAKEDPAFRRVLARVGTPQDRLDLVADLAVSAEILDLLAQSGKKAAPPYVEPLRALIAEPQSDRRDAAIRLIGAWRVQELANEIGSLSETDLNALKVWPLIADPGVTTPAFHSRYREAPLPEVLEAFAISDLGTAASAFAEQPPGDPARYLTAFTNRKGGLIALASAFEAFPPSPELAATIETALAQTGQTEAGLAQLLAKAQGRSAARRDHSPELVASLVELAEKDGDAGKGREIFHRPALACIACHQIGDAGGVIGPALDTVGAGLPNSLIVESILWPDRQLKEGYFSETIVEKNGRTRTGYVQREVAGSIWILDTTTNSEHAIAKDQIESRTNLGSIMPAGLTDSLSDEELAHLIRYLSEKR